MNIEEGKERGVTSGNPPQPGVANYPPQSVIGFHQPISPSVPPPPSQFYAHGDQAAGPGHPVSEGIPTETVYGPLPCCGIGIGWLLFILGFFLAFIPWYVGAIMLRRVKDNDKREKPGLMACTIAAVIFTSLMTVIVALAFLFFMLLGPVLGRLAMGYH